MLVGIFDQWRIVIIEQNQITVISKLVNPFS